MSEHKRIAIVDGSGNAQLADVVESSTNPGVFGLVILNADGTEVSGGSGGQIMFDAIVAPTGGDYTLLSAAIAAGKKTIYVKKGTYLETAAINIANDGTFVLGEDKSLTIIQQTTAGQDLIKNPGKNYVTFQNLTLDCQTYNAQACFASGDGQPSGSPDPTKGNYTIVDNCILKGGATFVVYFAGPSFTMGAATLTGFENNQLNDGNRVTNCQMTSSLSTDAFVFALQKNGRFDGNRCEGGRMAFYMNRNSTCNGNVSLNSASVGIFFAGPAYDNNMNNNEIFGCTDSGIKLQNQGEHTPLLAGQSIRGNTLSGNVVTNSGNSGFEFNNAELNTLVGNTFNNPANHGIYLETSSKNVISGNVIRNPRANTGNARASGIYMVSNVTDNIIEGNQIIDDRTVQQMYCAIANREGGDCQRNTIKNNKLLGKNTQTTMWINSNDWDISGNQVEGGDFSGIYLAGACYTRVIGNECRNNTNGANNSYAEIWCKNTSTNNIISGNVISSTATNKARYGIYFETAAETLNQVGKNQFVGIVTSDIKDDGTSNTFFSIDMDSTGNVRNIKSETYGTSNDRSQIQMPHPDGSGGSIFSYSGISGYSATEFSRNNYYDPTAANWKYYDNAKQAATWLLDQDGDAELWQAAAGTQPISTWQMVYRLTTGGVQWLKQQAATPSDPDAGFGALYFKNDGKLYKKIASTETEIGGLSWGSAINGATGTGIAQTMNDNYAAGGIGHSITLTNTQANAVTLLSLNSGTSTPAHTNLAIATAQGYGIDMTMANSMPASSMGMRVTMGNTQANLIYGVYVDTGTSTSNKYGIFVKNLGIGSTNSPSYGGIAVNSYTSLTQALGSANGISLGGSFNTSSAYHYRHLHIINDNNAGGGTNSGIVIRNNSTNPGVSTEPRGVGIGVWSQYSGGLGIHSLLGPSQTGSTAFKASMDNTQAGANTLISLDTGSSAYAHSAINIAMSNNTSTARALKITSSGSSAGTLIDITTNSFTGYVIYAKNVAYGPGTPSAGGIQLQNYVGTYFQVLGDGSTTITGNFNGGVGGGVYSARTKPMLQVVSTRLQNTNNAITDNYSAFHVQRNSTINYTGQTFIQQGVVARFENVLTQTAGTLTDTVDVLLLNQATLSTGNLVKGQKAGVNTFIIDKDGNFLTI